MRRPSLAFLGEQLQRVLAEQAEMRDQIAVLTGLVLRVEGSMTALLAQSRLTDRRVTKVERPVPALEKDR